MIGSEIYTIKGILVATQLLRQRSGSHVPYTCCGIETAQRDQSQEYDQTFLRLTLWASGSQGSIDMANILHMTHSHSRGLSAQYRCRWPKPKLVRVAQQNVSNVTDLRVAVLVTRIAVLAPGPWFQNDRHGIGNACENVCLYRLWCHAWNQARTIYIQAYTLANIDPTISSDR